MTSLHTTVMKQGEELKSLALENQELEHVVKVQEMKIKELKDSVYNQKVKVDDTLLKQDKKVVLICKQVQGQNSMNVHEGNAMYWVNVAKNEVVNNAITQVTSHGRNLHSEKFKEMQERAK